MTNEWLKNGDKGLLVNANESGRDLGSRPGERLGARQISRITGMMRGRRLVDFWMKRFRSLRIFSLITP